MYIVAFDNRSCLQVLDHLDLSRFELGSEIDYLFSAYSDQIDLIYLAINGIVLN